MRLEQSFEVEAPLERVWSALIDVERVAPCLPGAAVTGRNDDGSYNGSFSVKIGPTSASYSGKLQMQELDEAAHRATMRAQGTDKRGQGGADATIVSTLESLGEGRTRVEVDTDYRITGRLARFGRGGMIEDIANKLLRQFAGSLQELVSDGGASEPAPAPAVAVSSNGGGPAEEPDPSEDSAIAGAAPVAAPVDSAELNGLALVGSVVLERIKRNPVPAVVAGAVLIVLLARRRT
jgi:carbon monoxide dehydrogenase subunit G